VLLSSIILRFLRQNVNLGEMVDLRGLGQTFAGTSHSAVSRSEKGTSIPQLPTLQRIAAVLEEEMLVCFQRTADGEIEREFAAVA
jgi:transcriptional regulator with XRE-family HTH domain